MSSKQSIFINKTRQKGETFKLLGLKCPYEIGGEKKQAENYEKPKYIDCHQTDKK